MHRRMTHPGFRSAIIVFAAIATLCGVGCSNKQKPELVLPSRYPQKEKREVPRVFEDSILQHVDLGGTEMAVISGYGLVTDLRGTGDSTASTPVREFMIKTMHKRGFGSPNTGYTTSPERVLADPRVAIVRVDGLIPPGARQGQLFDVFVSPPTERNTTRSLVNGQLYTTDLRVNGANEFNLNSLVHTVGKAAGPVTVNPAYALLANPSEPAAQRSLRHGLVMDGGVYYGDRPLILQLRQPQRSLARMIEYRIREHFQDESVASAQDEGIIHLHVPKKYGEDWAHFAGVVTHLYLRSSVEMATVKAAELAEEAVKPDAPLADISYAWEGLGPPAIKAIRPLMTHANPDVAFAAARAAAFIGDSSARNALLAMANDPRHKFQLDAVRVLGAMPASAEINGMLRKLLDTNQAMLRIEAYRVLARNRDPLIYSRVIRRPRQTLEKFVLDIVPCNGPPMIYATREGMPRIVIFGNKPSIDQPMMFSAIDNAFTISSTEENVLTLFYRGGNAGKAVKVLSQPDVAELVARLGGEGAPGMDRLDFSYSEIVGMLQKMADGGKLSSVADGRRIRASVVLEEMPDVDAALGGAPVIPDGGRPQSTEGGQLGMNSSESNINASAR